MPAISAKIFKFQVQKLIKKPFSIIFDKNKMMRSQVSD